MARICTLHSAICSAVASAPTATTIARGDALRESHRPLEHPHPAHRSAHHAEPPVDPEVVGQRDLDDHLVPDRDPWEARPVRPTVGRVRRRSGGSLAAAEHVRAHHEEAVGVDRRARTDHPVPPPGLAVARSGGTGCVAVSGERVQHEHRVVARGIERAPCLVRDGHVLEASAGFENVRARVERRHELATTGIVAGAPRAGDGDRWRGREVGRVSHPSRRGTRRRGRRGCRRSSRCRRTSARGRAWYPWSTALRA